MADSRATAEEASLRYVSDDTPGLRRFRVGRGFRYVAADGSPVRDFAVRRRIRALAIPPAWTDVWICAAPGGHIQAVGRDAKGRKQYRYHARWRETRDATKYARLALFAERLPAIRRRVDEDLGRAGLPREKIVAAVVRLLELSLIRVGNAEYAAENGSFGLTTLRDRHVTVLGSSLRFEFRGKGGKPHVVDVADRRLARIVRQCQELPGHELFQCVGEDGQRHAIGSADVNAYLREVAGEEFTAKDFRTWAGTVLAASALRDGVFESEAEAKRNVARTIETVAKRLGNTPAICRKCYVHPAVVEAYVERTLSQGPERAAERAASPPGLEPDEAALYSFLRIRRLPETGAHQARRPRAPVRRPAAAASG
jgi:DNA topoisomerase-1